jgi:hypothetical protein
VLLEISTNYYSLVLFCLLKLRKCKRKIELVLFMSKTSFTRNSWFRRWTFHVLNDPLCNSYSNNDLYVLCLSSPASDSAEVKFDVRDFEPAKAIVCYIRFARMCTQDESILTEKKYHRNALVNNFLPEFSGTVTKYMSCFVDGFFCDIQIFMWYLLVVVTSRRTLQWGLNHWSSHF